MGELRRIDPPYDPYLDEPECESYLEDENTCLNGDTCSHPFCTDHGYENDDDYSDEPTPDYPIGMNELPPDSFGEES